MKGVPFSIKLLGLAACVVVVGTVVWSIVVVGTPGTRRERRADGNRIDNLAQISGEVERYYERKKKLPETLDDLLKGESYLHAASLLDQETGARYRYKAGEGSRYKLGATFVRDYEVEGWSTYGDSKFKGYQKGEWWFDLDADTGK